MGWAVFARGVWAVTGRLAVEFRQPVEVGARTRVSGRIATDRGRVLEVEAELRRDGDDLLLARATATFMRVPEAKARDWQRRYLSDISQEACAGR
jgi:acyl-coenzyme A thioesterase PaaI-like protein